MTILEASRRLNVSKTTVRKFLTPEFREQYCTSRPNGAINISAEGFMFISEHLTDRKEAETDTENRKPTDRPNRPITDQAPIIEFLQSQIAVMNEQIAKKDEQIASLQEQNAQLTASLQNTTESLNAAQLLHAADKPQLLEQNEETEQKEKKRHWWSRK